MTTNRLVLLLLLLLELLFTGFELAVVGLFFDAQAFAALTRPELLLAGGTALLLWLGATALWLLPVVGPARTRRPQKTHRAALSVPGRSLLLRLCLWTALALAAALLQAEPAPGAPPRFSGLPAFPPLVALGVGLLRWAAHQRLLRAFLARQRLLPASLEAQADTLPRRLTEVSVLLGFAAMALFALFVEVVSPLPGARIVHLLSLWFPVPLLAGLVRYRLLLPRQLAPLTGYLRSASSGRPLPVAELLRASRAAHSLPFFMGFSGQVLTTAAGALVLLPAAALGQLQPQRAVLWLLALGICATAGAVYEMIWSRLELRPVVADLLARYDVEPLELRAASLRHKMLLSVGGITLVVVSLPVVVLTGHRLFGNTHEAHPAALLLLFFVLLALALGVVGLTIRDLIAPLSLLERRAAEMAQGALHEQVQHQGEFDTSGRLSSAFEQMRRNLVQKLRTIEKMNEELEEKVRQRTAELQRSNAELVQAIEALQEAQAQLVRSEKLASVGQLVAGIAHEINNPINAVVNTVGPLSDTVAELSGGALSEAEQAECRDDLAQMLRVIRSGTRRAQRIVGALRNYARQDTESCQAVDLHAELDETLALLSHALQRVAVSREFSHEGPLTAYRGQLNQALMNLLSNAAAAVEGAEAPRITVRTRDEAEEEAVVIEVEDNGSGIPEAIKGRIFDPFFTTKEVGRGTGLGLSITHTIIVERHGGAIAVESEPGRTCFTLTLPRRPPAAADR